MALKQKYSPGIEAGRVDRGMYASQVGDRSGMFIVRGPRGQSLRIIASDGSDWEACKLEGEPWEHVSVSVDGRRDLMPSWGEMHWVKEQFFEPEELVVQFHPPQSVYVNHHPGVLHLWRPTATTIPLPPVVCV